MASPFGLAVTNLTSRFGFLSRKACIRLATETGEKVLARKAELGRNLNKQEIEQVFSEIIPKRCRPKVITEDHEVVECLKRLDFSEQQIAEQINSCNNAAMVAAVICNGTKKMKLWIPFGRIEKFEGPIRDYIETTQPAFIAHEMEHALEKNCRIKDIVKRKISKIYLKVKKLFDKDYIEKVNKRQIGVHNFEAKMQECLTPIAEINGQTGLLQLKCKPTVEGISDYFQQTEGVSLAYKLRHLMRKEYANDINTNSETRKRLKLMKYWMDMERPAYEVTGKIERKIYGLKENEYAINEAIAAGYEAAIGVAKQERKTYWLNKILGFFVKKEA